jgi:Uma2 family endonuclease
MAVQTLTAEEFLTLPASGLPTELIHGEVIVSPAPELNHQDIVLQVALLLKQQGRGKVYIAPVDVYLDESNIVQPDVLWIAPEGGCIAVDGKFLRGAPDLVVEVSSPATARRDKKDKFRLYERHGVREYWLIDPAQTLLEAWQLQDNRFMLLDIVGPGDTFTSALVGAVDLSKIFSRAS